MDGLEGFFRGFWFFGGRGDDGDIEDVGVGCKKYGIFEKKCSFVFLNPYFLEVPLIAHVPDIYSPLFLYFAYNKGIRELVASDFLLRALLKIRAFAISFFERIFENLTANTFTSNYFFVQNQK